MNSTKAVPVKQTSSLLSVPKAQDLLTEALKGRITEILQGLVLQEATAFVEAISYERTESRRGYRHGTVERELTTSLGKTKFERPRVKVFAEDDRQTEWKSNLVPRYSRRCQSIGFVMPKHLDPSDRRGSLGEERRHGQRERHVRHLAHVEVGPPKISTVGHTGGVPGLLDLGADAFQNPAKCGVSLKARGPETGDPDSPPVNSREAEKIARRGRVGLHRVVTPDKRSRFDGDHIIALPGRTAAKLLQHSNRHVHVRTRRGSLPKDDSGRALGEARRQQHRGHDLR